MESGWCCCIGVLSLSLALLPFDFFLRGDGDTRIISDDDGLWSGLEHMSRNGSALLSAEGSNGVPPTPTCAWTKNQRNSSRDHAIARAAEKSRWVNIRIFKGVCDRKMSTPQNS
jgi:hypothetical protein